MQIIANHVLVVLSNYLVCCFYHSQDDFMMLEAYHHSFENGTKESESYLAYPPSISSHTSQKRAGDIGTGLSVNFCDSWEMVTTSRGLQLRKLQNRRRQNSATIMRIIRETLHLNLRNHRNVAGSQVEVEGRTFESSKKWLHIAGRRTDAHQCAVRSALDLAEKNSIEQLSRHAITHHQSQESSCVDFLCFLVGWKSRWKFSENTVILLGAIAVFPGLSWMLNEICVFRCRKGGHWCRAATIAWCLCGDPTTGPIAILECLIPRICKEVTIEASHVRRIYVSTL